MHWAVLATIGLAPTPQVPLPPPQSPAALDLRWSAPPQCPTADEIRERYLAMLSASPAGLGTMTVDARVKEEGERWTLVLATQFGGNTEERTLEAPTCTALADATAMLLAIALEPGLEPPAAGEGPTGVVPPPKPSMPPTRDPPSGPSVATNPDSLAHEIRPASQPESDARRTERDARGFLRPFGGVEYGAVPGLAAYLGISGGALLRHARLEFDLAWLSPRQAAGPRDSSARVQAVVGSAHACLRPRWAEVEFPICGGLEGGLVRAAASGLPNATPVAGPWLGPSTRFAAAYAWSRVGVFGGLGVALRAWGTRLRIDDEVVFTPTLVSIRALMGLEVFF